MTKYNLYCKDDSILENVYVTLTNISHGIDNVQYVTSEFMPRCVAFSTEVYTDEGLVKLLSAKNIPKDSFIILRHLHKRQVL